MDKGQSALEYLLLVGGAVLVAVIVISMFNLFIGGLFSVSPDFRLCRKVVRSKKFVEFVSCGAGAVTDG